MIEKKKQAPQKKSERPFIKPDVTLEKVLPKGKDKVEAKPVATKAAQVLNVPDTDYFTAAQQANTAANTVLEKDKTLTDVSADEPASAGDILAPASPADLSLSVEQRLSAATASGKSEYRSSTDLPNPELDATHSANDKQDRWNTKLDAETRALAEAWLKENAPVTKKAVLPP
ncbi:MAG: hypothetical protein AAGL90_10080 [Pseudomonadota bacterium]